MKKIIIFATILFLNACTKQTTNKLDSSSSDEIRSSPIVTFDSMCFDGTNYRVRYTISGLRDGDELFGGTKIYFKPDTLFKVQLHAGNGSGYFQAPTGESGCTVEVFMLVIGKYQKHYHYITSGNCKTCVSN
jgi:hypothetical protein